MNGSKVPTFKARYIAAGFREDVTALLDDFVRRNSSEFDDFRAVFVKARFSLIFQGRQNETEMALFTQEVFRIVLSLLPTSPSNLYKTGILYLLYSLYFVQPFDKFPIRIQSHEFEELFRLVLHGLEKTIVTIPLTFRALHKEQAFWFVPTARPMGFMAVPPATDEETVVPKSVDEENPEIVQVDCGLSETESLVDTYVELKNQLQLHDLTGKFADTGHEDFMQALRQYDAFNRNEDWSEAGTSAFNAQYAPTTSGEDRPPAEGNDKGAENFGQRRASLKMQQFGRHNLTPAVARCRELMSNENTMEMDSVPQAKEEICDDDEIAPLVIDVTSPKKQTPKKKGTKEKKRKKITKKPQPNISPVVQVPDTQSDETGEIILMEDDLLDDGTCGRIPPLKRRSQRTRRTASHYDVEDVSEDEA